MSPCKECGSLYIYYSETACASCGWHAPGQTTFHADFAPDEDCEWCVTTFKEK